MIDLAIHNIDAPESPNPVITEDYFDSFTVRYFTFANLIGSKREEITVKFFDYSAKARRERENMTYSWGSQR